jgi:hypothetical protein
MPPAQAHTPGEPRSAQQQERDRRPRPVTSPGGWSTIRSGVPQPRLGLLDGRREFGQVVVDGRFDDAEGRVVIVMRELVTHRDDLPPGDRRVGREPFGAEGAHGLADLHEAHADGVERQRVGEVAPLEVAGDRGVAAERRVRGARRR